MSFAIAILNYNGAELLERFLPSVLAYSGEAKIYVIDNGSTDASKQLLAEKFSSVNLIALQQNLGYAGGYNAGMKQIDESIVCLLNSDVAVSENWTTPIIGFFRAHANVAVVQPKIKDLNNPSYFEYAGAAGGYLDLMGLPYCRGRVGKKCALDTGQYDDNMAVTWASGSCFFVRKSAFQSLGGFDDSFFMHFEEIDFCLRAKNEGHEVWYVGESEVFHLGAGSLQKDNPKKLFFNIRNSLLTYVKNLSFAALIWVFMLRAIFDTTLYLVYLVRLKLAHANAIVQGHCSFVKHFIGAWKKRKETSNPLRFFSSLR